MGALSTDQFPQADRLGQVGLVAIAVSKGHATDAAIEKYLGLDSANRQGRYYRKAAEILGLVTTFGNKSNLTDEGVAFVALPSDADRTEFLAKCLTDTPVFREVARFIVQKKPKVTQLSDFIVSIYPGSATTARRRASTIAAFVVEAGLAKVTGGAYVPGGPAAASIVINEKAKSGLLGKPVPTDPVTNKPLVANPQYEIVVDSAKLERANLVHHKLVATMAAFLAKLEIQARQNEVVDVFAETTNGGTILYEMKSITDSNFVAQMRRAIAQLCEYRYVFGVPHARLCVVTNGCPERRTRWYLDYLQGDREIAFVWTEDFSTLLCEPPSSLLLGDVAP